MKKFSKSLIVTVFAGLLIIIGHPVFADQSQETEQQKCVKYLKKCFSPENYEYLYDFSTLSKNDCWLACKRTETKVDGCDFDMCFEMCKVASGYSKEACPIPTEPIE
jgi:hypothetical protein